MVMRYADDDLSSGSFNITLTNAKHSANAADPARSLRLHWCDGRGVVRARINASDASAACT